MAYRLSLHAGGAFFVPAKAAEGLRFSGAAQLRVLLCYLCRGNWAEDPSPIAKELNMTGEDVLDALDYWVEKGVLEKDGISPEKVSLSPQDAGLSVPTGPAQTSMEPNAPGQASDGSKPPEQALAVTAPERAFAPPPEIKPTMFEVNGIVKKNPNAAFVLKEAEARLGKAFSSSDTATLVWLLEWAGIAPDVLVTVVEYCKTAGHISLRYIQKVALEWQDAGIDNIEKAEERIRVLSERKSWEGELKAVLGISARGLTTKEKEYAEAWRMLGLSPELIRTAYERMVDAKGTFTFPYMNKILVSWKSKGITTPEQAAAEKKPGPPPAKTPSFDPVEIGRRAREMDPIL